MTPEDILNKLATTYSAVRSYQDVGVHLTFDPDVPEPHEVHFSTFFTRPGLFRFEWSFHHPYPPLRHRVTRSVVCSDGARITTCRKRFGGEVVLEADEDLRMAVAGATGVSRGTALTIHSLLQGDLEMNYSPADLTEITMLDDELIDSTT